MLYISNNTILPSYVERLIISELNAKLIRFEREVTFEGLKNPKTGAPLRFDFYLPDHKTIIEYDGREWHNNTDVRFRDQIKNDFAVRNKLRLIRIQSLGNISKFFDGKLQIRLRQIQPVQSKKKSYSRLMPIRPKKHNWEPSHEAKMLIGIHDTDIEKYYQKLDNIMDENKKKWRSLTKQISRYFRERKSGNKKVIEFS